MKTNMTKSYKFFVAVIALVLICTVAFGASKAFAEPPLKDRVEILGTGTFHPKELYSDVLIDRTDAEFKIVAWLPTTELTFSETLWSDSNGDGKIHLTEDVYAKEDFLTELLSKEMGYPIYDIGQKDYYIMPLLHHGDFDEAVIVQFQISKDNDLASLFDENTYWFDTDNYIVYIDKEVVDNHLNEENIDMRGEIITVVEDINTATKSLGVFTVFDEDIENTYGLYSNTPNGVYHQPFKHWALYGLEYRLIKPDYLAYVSAEDLDVFVDGVLLEDDMWYYNESNGMMTINCDAYRTQYIIVKFNQVQEPQSSQVMLQSLQSGNMGQAGEGDLTALKAKMGGMKNHFLNNITFTEMPQVGDYDVCNSTATVRYNAGGVTSVSGLASALDTICDTSLIRKVCTNVFNDLEWSGDYILSGSLSIEGGGSVRNEIGRISYNLALAEYYKNDASKKQEYLAAAETAIENYMNGLPGINYAPLKSKWNIPGCGRSVYIAGRTGPLQNTFLGGTINVAEDGYAMFDLSCCEMSMPFSGGIDGDDFPGNSWIAQTTIVDIDTKTKELIVCAWSASWHNNGGAHGSQQPQKLLGFSRIPYTYDSDGWVQFSKTDPNGKILEGAVYRITGITDPTYLKEITTTGAQMVFQLPIGDYTLTEITPPKGYAKTNTSLNFTITADHSEEENAYQLSVQDEPQKVNGTLYVWDKQYRVQSANKNDWIPVAGVKFDLYNEGGHKVQTNLTSDINGRITFEFNAMDGVHYLLQSTTVSNYTVDEDCKKKIFVQPESGEWADTTGEHKTWYADHFEPRQIADIHSQVLDYDLNQNGKPTPAVFNNTILNEESAGYTSTVGAKYELYTKEKILLGYDSSKNPITVDAGKKLTVCWDPASLPISWHEGEKITNAHKYQQYINFRTSCSDFIVDSIEQGVVSQEIGGHAYVSAYTVRNPNNPNDTNLYPLPNGSYEWRLVEPSQGYSFNHTDKQSIAYKNHTTAITLPWVAWDGTNSATAVVHAIDPVIEVRQRIQIDLFVKFYDKENRIASSEYASSPNAVDWVTIKEDVPAVETIPQKHPIGVQHYDDLMREDITKTVLSSMINISKNSTERVTVKDDGNTVLTVQSLGLVAGSVYELVSLEPIVDIETGEVIKARQVLGKYIITDANGEGTYTFTKIGSDGFVHETIGAIPPIQVETLGSKQITTADLPNGVYALRCIGLPRGYEKEVAVANDIVITAQWKKETSNKTLIPTRTSTLLFKDTEDANPKPIIAPDPSEFPELPDPDDGLPEQIDLPENPTQIPTISDDVKIVIDWIDKNRHNIAYRITDKVNITTKEDNTISYDVQDKLPTTFAMYMRNLMVRDSDEESKTDGYDYEIAFYYEISAAEYNKAPAADKSDIVDIDKTYIKINSNTYAKKFNMNDASAVDYIGSQIVLNPESMAYADSMTSVKSHNLPLFGALYNTVWLNDQLSKQTDNEFDIFVVSRTTRWFQSFDTQIHTDVWDSQFGILRIKVRELINLD